MADKQLYDASYRGCLSDVRHLLKHGAQPDGYRGGGQWTALHMAANGGHTNIAKELLTHGADIHAKSISGYTPLHRAAYFGHVDTVQLLLQEDADLEQVNNHGNTALHEACRMGQLAVVKLLVESFLSRELLSLRGYRNQTPFEQAQAEGHTAVVKLLQQLELTRITAMGDKKLYDASWRGDLKEVKQLLTKGTKPEGYRDRDRCTALHLAAYNGHTEVVRELLTANADINAVDDKGDTPLHKVAYRGHEGAARLLLKKGAQLDMVNKDGNSALHEACRWGYLPVVRLMVEEHQGRNLLEVRGYNNQTPLEKAKAMKRSSVVDYLKQMEITPASGKAAIESSGKGCTRPKTASGKLSTKPSTSSRKDKEADCSGPESSYVEKFATDIGDYKVNFENPLSLWGRFSTVGRAHHKSNRDIVALKRVMLNKRKPDTQKELENEIKMHKDITTHRNIVKLMSHGIQRDSLFLVMELCDEGDLEQYFLASCPPLEVRLDLMKQATDGLIHLHSQSPVMVHRDISPQNILLHHEGKQLVLKLSLFGFAKKLVEHDPHSEYGSSRYVAPDVLPIPGMTTVTYTRESDIFSLGLLFQAMARFKTGDQGLSPLLDGDQVWSGTVAETMKQAEKMNNTIPTLAPVGDDEKFMWRKLNFIISCMTSYDPSKRSSLTDLKGDIESLKGTMDK